jgi:hypothetical protein
LKEHLYYIQKQKEATCGLFFSENHTSSKLLAQITAKVMPNTPQLSLEREKMWKRIMAAKTPSGLKKVTNSALSL